MIIPQEEKMLPVPSHVCAYTFPWSASVSTRPRPHAQLPLHVLRVLAPTYLWGLTVVTAIIMIISRDNDDH